MWRYNYTNSLYHYGVKGMRWGVIRDNLQKRRQAHTLSRKTKTLESVKSKKQKIAKAKSEADDRVKFYGGKNAATNAIKSEAKYAKNVEIGKGVAKGTLMSIGGTALYGLTWTTSPHAAVALLVASGIGTAVSTVRTQQAVKTIERHADEQIAYTKDSEYGSDLVITNKKK